MKTGLKAIYADCITEIVTDCCGNLTFLRRYDRNKFLCSQFQIFSRRANTSNIL